MGRKSSFIEGFVKRAGWYQNLAAKQGKPLSKLKRAVGWGALGTGAAAYGVHKATQDPEEKMVRGAYGSQG
jgi:hypothetical protein